MRKGQTRGVRMTDDQWRGLALDSPNAVLDAALVTLLHALRQVGSEQRGMTTASTDFTMEGLAQHLVDNAQTLASVIGVPVSATPVRDAADLETPVVETLWPVIEGLGGLNEDELIDFGQPVKVATVVKFLSVEFLVHAWDITHALSLDLNASEALVRAVHRHCQETRSSLFFNPETFHKPRTTPPDTSSLERLLALTGRGTRPEPDERT